MPKFGAGALFIAAIAALGSVSLLLTAPGDGVVDGVGKGEGVRPEVNAQNLPVSDGDKKGIDDGKAADGATNKDEAQSIALAGPQGQAGNLLVFCLPEPGPVSAQPGRACRTRAQLLSRERDRERRVAENETSKPLSVEMVTPNNPTEPPIRVESCAIFNKLKSEGWGGLTSLDMAREGTFETRCGIVKLARLARPAPASGFAEGELTASEIRAVPINSWPYFGEAPHHEDVIETESLGKGIWQLTYAGGQGRLTEVAHADFNEDGRGDILSYLVISPTGGTARISGFGLFEKRDADIAFSILSVY